MTTNQNDSFLKMNEKEFKKLKKEYQTAVSNKNDIFLFQNVELLTSYAKYLIEYLEMNKHKFI